MSALTKALVAARLELRGTVFKGGMNQAQRYAYVGHEQVIVGGARDALLKHGLVLEQRSVEFMGVLEFKTKSGDQMCWRWKGVHALCHESGEERLYAFEATTGTNDKASFVASTALDRTAHLRIMELAGSADEDPEHDSHDRQTPEPPRAVQAPSSGSKQVDPGAFLDAAFDLLKKADSEPALVEWYRRADRANVAAEAKTTAMQAFQKHCIAIGFVPNEIAVQAGRGNR